MLNRVPVLSSSDPIELWGTFPDWINLHRSKEGELVYKAKELSLSANAFVMNVEMFRQDKLIATYKYTISEVRGDVKSWFVFSPLVVVWEQGRAERGPDLGRIMIEHAVSAIQAFYKECGDACHDLLIASGNLTVAKGGKPFFEMLGWDIVYPSTHEPKHLYVGGETMVQPLTLVAEQIEAAIAPLRDTGKLEDGPISFAILTGY